MSGQRKHLDPDCEAASPAADRRVAADRRSRPTRFWGRAFQGQRTAGRRSGETENIYVDRYPRPDVMILLGIFILNIGDALFTLLWLQRGGGEANPIMRAMLDIGVGAFLFQKVAVVGLWLLILIIHRNYRTARIGLMSAFTVYSMLILYHIILVGSGASPIIREPARSAPHPIENSVEASEQDRERSLDPEDPIAQPDPPQTS